MSRSQIISSASVDLKIIVDARERPSGIVELLEIDGSFEIGIEQLEIGDYLISELVIERKTASDLKASLEDGRLFSQLLLMRRLYRRRLLMIEGSREELRSISLGHEGLVTKITTGLQIPIYWTKSPSHTARILRRIAIQLYGLGLRNSDIRRSKPRQDLNFQQRFILVGIPGIGLKRAIVLLKKFGTLEKIFNAPVDELASTELLGTALAQKIKNLFQSVYISKL